MSTLRRPALRGTAPAIALFLVTATVYGNGVANGFVWDDEQIVVNATYDLAGLGQLLLSPDEVPPYYRPLTRSSFLLDHLVFGLDPRGSHALNVALHAASVILLFALGRRLLSTSWAAGIGALLLAVHPIHGEAVNLVSARNNLLALAFSLATLVLFVDATRERSRRRLWLSGLAFLLALLSKEQGAMVLPVAAAWLFLPGTRARWHGWDAWRTLIPHALALGAYLVLRTVSLGGPAAAGDIADGLLGRLATNYHVLPRYLWLVVFPRDLTIFHSVVPPSGWAEHAAVILTWAVIAGALALAVRRPTLAGGVGVIWFASNLLPIANVVPLPSATVLAERFFHVPAVGLWLVAADAAERLASRGFPRWAGSVLAACTLVALAGRTVVRNLDWRDDLALASSAAEVDPRSSAAWFNVGVAQRERGDLAAARAAWASALAIDPSDAGALTQMGTLEALEGDLVSAEAYLRRALAVDPTITVALFNLAKILDRTGRPREALRHYERIVALEDPSYASLVPEARERVRALRAAGAR